MTNNNKFWQIHLKKFPLHLEKLNSEYLNSKIKSHVLFILVQYNIAPSSTLEALYKTINVSLKFLNF